MYDLNYTIDKPQVNSPSITVLQPCSSNIDSKDDLEQDLLFSDCRGEYRYFGNNVYRCLRVDGGLFACCDHPATCPGGDGGSDPEVN